MTAPTELADRARTWIDQDPDEDTRRELEDLLEAAASDDAAAADLAARFDGTLAFGTAGLRGALGAGPQRMNRVVVARAAAGIAAWLASTGVRRGSPVVVGYDARHKSDVFARDTAEVLRGAGYTALLMPRPLPTPVLAFAVRELGCVAGVMVTASHNPPADNGYKVYLADGAQLAPPTDAAIADAIAGVGRVDELPRGTDVTVLDEDVWHRYCDQVVDLVPDGPRDLRVVYTPLHGVGAETVVAVLEAAGFGEAHVVPQQREPDPDFSTVSFPNPEEPGAMDLALALAARVEADLVLANDPDADRCAVAVPTGRGWRMLTGDEVGALLGDHLAAHGRPGVLATTIVSSTLLGAVAGDHGRGHVRTLTGFKWLARVEDLAFAYEEAIGYCVAPHLVADKDGVSALLVLAHLAAALKADGRTFLDVLDDLAHRHGVHATDQLSVRVADADAARSLLQTLQADPPDRLGGLGVESLEDLAEEGGDLPPTDGLLLHLEHDTRLVVRPSGTEAKLKCYLEVVVPVEGDGPGTGDLTAEQALAAARLVAAQRLDAVRSELSRLLGA